MSPLAGGVPCRKPPTVSSVNPGGRAPTICQISGRTPPVAVMTISSAEPAVPLSGVGVVTVNCGVMCADSNV